MADQEEQVDLLICGSGSAGLCTAAYLAKCGLSCRIIEARDGPLKLGQADGVQCRTVEVYESFGLAEDVLRESYHVVEDVFWSRAEDGKLVRTRTSADTPKGLSHLPHVILNQARMHDFLLDGMKKWNGQEVEYNRRVLDVKVDSALATSDPHSYPVSVTTEKDGVKSVIRAKYALGCDGAHSTVRKSLGYTMVGDTTDAVWGVMDVYPRTNFHDIRKKGILRTPEGSLLIIPREGGSLVRFYIELPQGTHAKSVQLADLQATAKKIFAPFTMDIQETFWWSAYSIGQRHADFFSKDNRVFLTGDACHTHSPKAGQGMNTSLQDGHNIAWKLAHVFKGQAAPSLLKTYNLERERVAIDLIEFDREFSSAFSSKTKTDFSEFFIKSGRYTAGLTKSYEHSAITEVEGSRQHLAREVKVGMRFPSAQVVRFCDAKPVHVGGVLKADGRWRVIVCPGDIHDAEVTKSVAEVRFMRKSGKWLCC
jgi:phenol 2-monooxygenase